MSVVSAPGPAPAPALDTLAVEVREALRARSGVLAGNEGLREVIGAVVASYQDRYATGAPGLRPLGPPEDVAAALFEHLAGFGPLSPLMCDPAVEEIWVNGPSQVFAARGGEHHLTTVVFRPGELEDLVERLLAATGRRLDRAQPFVDARLPDGSRLHVTVPPVTAHWAVNIRKFVGLRAHTLDELVGVGSVTKAAARFLAAAVHAGLNIVVGGAVGAGKTTLLNCLAGAVPPRERVVTCEEVFELDIALPDVVAMQCRQANLEGSGEIPLRTLVKESLRMRPDRILVGEVRGAEALDMLLALNAGCGGMTSVHANTAREALRKLATLPLLAGENVDRRFVVATVAAVIDLVVFCRRDRGGRRRVSEVLAVAEQVGGDGTISSGTVFVTDAAGDLVWTGEFPRGAERFTERGIDLARILGGTR